MDKKVVKNIFFYGVGDFIVTGVTAFLFIPLYIKYLSVSDYGVFNILNNNSTIFTYIFQFGIISAFSRIYFLKKSADKEKTYIWNIIYLHIFYSIALFILIFLFRTFIFSNLSPSIKNLNFLFYPVSIAFFTFLPALYYVYLRLEEKASVFVSYQIINVVLITSCILYNLLFRKLDLNNILLCFIITNLVLWAIVLFKFSRSYSYGFDLGDITETLKFSYPIFISYIAYFFISKYSIVILQNHVSLNEIGLFSLAQQIASIPSLVTIAITKAVQPYLFSSTTNEELRERSQKFDSSYKLIMVWFVGSMIFCVDILFSHILPESYYPIHNVTKYLLLISLIYNFSIVENSVLLYFMRSKTILLITVIGSITNVLLSNILVYRFSIYGVVLSMFIAFLINFLLDLYFSAKHINLKYNIKELLPAAGIVGLYLFVSSELFPSLSNWNFSFSIIGFLILTVIVVISLKKTNYDFTSKTENKS